MNHRDGREDEDPARPSFNPKAKGELMDKRRDCPNKGK